jgi:2,3-bisphosphoglycerate-dependent phosphoglycerate mutase
MPEPMLKLVLLRHGESQWNLENRFTGWADVDLTENGPREAQAAAELLRDEGFTFDIAYTSVSARHSHTVDRAGRAGLDVAAGGAQLASERASLRSAAGAQQGLTTATKFGEEQVSSGAGVIAWRPPLPPSDPRRIHDDPRYKHVLPTRCR